MQRNELKVEIVDTLQRLKEKTTYFSAQYQSLRIRLWQRQEFFLRLRKMLDQTIDDELRNLDESFEAIDDGLMSEQEKAGIEDRLAESAQNLQHDIPRIYRSAVYISQFGHIELLLMDASRAAEEFLILQKEMEPFDWIKIGELKGSKPERILIFLSKVVKIEIPTHLGLLAQELYKIRNCYAHGDGYVDKSERSKLLSFRNDLRRLNTNFSECLSDFDVLKPSLRGCSVELGERFLDGFVLYLDECVRPIFSALAERWQSQLRTWKDELSAKDSTKSP